MNSADFTLHPWYWNPLLSSVISSGENSMHFLQLMSFTILQFLFHRVSITAGWTEVHDMRDRGSNSWPLDHDSTFYVIETPALTTRPSVTLPIHIQCQCAVILQWLKNPSLMYFVFFFKGKWGLPTCNNQNIHCHLEFVSVARGHKDILTQFIHLLFKPLSITTLQYVNVPNVLLWTILICRK